MAFIIKPMVTEKMTKITDKSSVERTYKVKGQERTKKAETYAESIASYLRVVLVLGITMAITSQCITTFALSSAYGTPFSVLFFSRLPVTVITLLTNAFVVDLFVRKVKIPRIGAFRSIGSYRGSQGA